MKKKISYNTAMGSNIFSIILQTTVLIILVEHQFFISPVLIMAGHVPVGGIEYRYLNDSHSSQGGRRRVLEPFQLCLQCKCCAANDPTNCSSMPCCFGISCDLPDKPYGVCAFVPKICNCTACT